jgi:hypothetical protein
VVADSSRVIDLVAILRIIRRDVKPRDASAAMDRPFRARLVVTRDQLARSSSEQLRHRATGTEAVAQLLHLAARRFFGERGLIEVWPSGDVAVPLRSDFPRGDFRIHHRKGCGYRPLEVNVDAICCGAERNAQPLVLRAVDARVRDLGDDRVAVRCGRRRSSADPRFAFGSHSP